MSPSAIVTGSDSGIGRATALALARSGFDIGVTWHSDERGADGTATLVREAGRRAYVSQLDVARPAWASDVVKSLAALLGRLDVLVNSAAIDHCCYAVDETVDAWTRVLAVNLTGAFACAQTAARLMIAQGEGGRIINITSIHEHVPSYGRSAYCASKGALGALTKVMALELSEHSITVNSIAPGHIATPMTETTDHPETRRDGIPVGRIGEPGEVAALAAHLCSPAAHYITGGSYLVDGGLSLMSVVSLQRSISPA